MSTRNTEPRHTRGRGTSRLPPVERHTHHPSPTRGSRTMSASAHPVALWEFDDPSDPLPARSEERRVGKECRSRCDWSSDVCSSDLLINGSNIGYRCLHGIPSPGTREEGEPRACHQSKGTRTTRHQREDHAPCLRLRTPWRSGSLTTRQTHSPRDRKSVV